MPYLGKEPARVPVTAADIPDNSITAAKIIDGAITIADIANDAVTEDKLANSINTAIAANTAKTGITSGQASAITANTAKTGITSTQADAIVANTAKTGITSGQASAITANTAKTGITSGQASAITANTAKVTNATHTGDVTGSTALTIAVDAVDIPMLSATGTAGSTTFLRGDNTWATAGSTSASDLTSGTLPDARFPSTLPAISGANLTGLTAGGPSLGTASVIRTNAQTISENITIGSTTNGMSAGPITIADSYTVTVNGNWSIV
jgi:hypothetical protein